MKYKVIKEYAGIEVGSIVRIADGSVKYMVGQGYVEQVETVDVVKIETPPAQNKAIEPKYKRNKIK